ncbi:MAG TPA: ABC-F family ATP-binding cassette domain-containing protein [Candidatus Eisenbergiella stercorigallinarum]|uniref:ABC-F family ATP-binding cassette domain-containing protein n=1 Tax=Candidatus Eisenbergiella stercorigallinarum TaxID=2838557 RepID=A0A9D2U0H3_9FIRM|nr:ABC-F family ATP-binding cassette domain-containing protein [Candidatus Eisenbergiella stercorigallinarum]
MNLINIEKITKSFTDHKLFDNASFSLQEGEMVGVIGINGTGKTTLLRMMAGLEEPDEGTITTANHAVIRYLPQHPEFDPEMSCLDCVLAGNVTEENRWTIESDAKAMMTRLGIRDFAQPAGQLSGGQRKRLALISALLAPADILLLDEPTNHLDNEMADWLEDYLKKWKGALVMVTHDRYFLDSVANRIVEIDKGTIYSYQANYSGFLELKTQRQEMEEASERKRQSILRVELEWIRRGARARSTKQKAHIQRFEELRDRQAPVRDSSVELGSISSRMGRTTVELISVCKSYGEKKLIDDFNYIFLKGDRVGFIGPNGCGKTTLMKIIAGLLPPDSGQVVVGQTVKMGYYAQEIASRKQQTDVSGGQSVDAFRGQSTDAPGAMTDLSYMDPKQRVIDYVKDTAEYIQTTDGVLSASAMLERFLFLPDKQYSPIGKLSGGEKKRLNLLRVLASSPNFLLLDEPTNNLDIATLTILEDYLDRFEGIVVTVSHDRYFLDRTMKRIFAFEEDGRLRQYEGGYTDYAARKAAEEEEKESQEEKRGSCGKPDIPVAEKGQRVRGPQKLKFSYKEQKDYETIEADMAALEERISTLEQDIEASASDFVKLNQLMAEKAELEAALEEKMERWMYLEELAAKIAEQGKG